LQTDLSLGTITASSDELAVFLMGFMGKCLQQGRSFATMAKLQRKIQLFVPFLVGIIFGSVGLLWYLNAFGAQPTIRFQGVAKLDTASHNNSYFNNAIYLQSPTTLASMIYLRFQDNAAMNAAINKRVVVSGRLKMVDIGDEQRVTELDVFSVEPVKQ
jgi:hypothetical protein